MTPAYELARYHLRRTGVGEVVSTSVAPDPNFVAPDAGSFDFTPTEADKAQLKALGIEGSVHAAPSISFQPTVSTPHATPTELAPSKLSMWIPSAIAVGFLFGAAIFLDGSED